MAFLALLLRPLGEIRLKIDRVLPTCSIPQGSILRPLMVQNIIPLPRKTPRKSSTTNASIRYFGRVIFWTITSALAEVTSKVPITSAWATSIKKGLLGGKAIIAARLFASTPTESLGICCRFLPKPLTLNQVLIAFKLAPISTGFIWAWYARHPILTTATTKAIIILRLRLPLSFGSGRIVGIWATTIPFMIPLCGLSMILKTRHRLIVLLLLLKSISNPKSGLSLKPGEA